MQHCKFSEAEIDTACRKIFGQSIMKLQRNDPGAWMDLIDEYRRLDQMPSISLIKDIEWSSLVWNETRTRYEFAADARDPGDLIAHQTEEGLAMTRTEEWQKKMEKLRYDM